MSLLLRIVVSAGATFLALQLVPYGRSHDNPPVVAEPAWPTPALRAQVSAACFDCHSHETVWPWYSHVAPVSWLVQRDVDVGRAHLNFSRWDQPQEHAEDMGEEVREGEMPMPIHALLHEGSRLDDATRATLAKALDALPLPGGAGREAAEPTLAPEGEGDDDD